MNKLIQIFLSLLIFSSCDKNEVSISTPKNEILEFISAADISSYPEVSISEPKFHDLNGQEKEFLTILKENGINTIRLRLWVNPKNEHSGFNEVKQFSESLKMKGFKIWLTVHYSDTWADPAHQELPQQWSGINFSQLTDSVHNYTEKVMNEIQPDYIQIGNEINPGFLHPYGHISNNFQQFLELMKTAISAVRINSNDTKIMLHYAGIDGSDWFFKQVELLDYDIIALSYYPIWHGKSLDLLQTTMNELSNSYHKQIVIAETAYPFTLEWNDWTNNIVGLEDHLILPEFPASMEGQRSFITKIKTMTKEVENGIGFCYWGAELIAWKGSQSENASPWENQALFDFENKALPVLREFVTD